MRFLLYLLKKYTVQVFVCSLILGLSLYITSLFPQLPWFASVLIIMYFIGVIFIVLFALVILFMGIINWTKKQYILYKEEKI